MEISFDLDDTLIPSRKSDFPLMKRSWLQNLLQVENLRAGTKEVFEVLQVKGHQVGIYTTSFRPVWKIKWQMLTYGIKPDFIINEPINRNRLKSIGVASSKYPPAFDIHWHIDDSIGVAIEGERHGFNTVILKKSARQWGAEVLRQIDARQDTNEE